MPLQSTQRVLLIEDNPADVYFLQLQLAEVSSTLELVSVPTLRDAIATLAPPAPAPDLIILDLGLPDSLGLETLKQIRAAALATPIIVLTEADNLALGIEAKAARLADEWIRKGASAQEITAQLAWSFTLRAKRRDEASELLEQQLDQVSRMLLEAQGALALLRRSG